MPTQPPSKPTLPLDAIEFEATDFDSARQALDELPPGVAEVMYLQPGFWEQKRRKTTATDRALTGAAMDWVIGLPPALRPHATCEQFPRVVNAIAAAWSDAACSMQLLDTIVNDRRGGRRGFPDVVKRELVALYEHQRAGSRS